MIIPDINLLVYAHNQDDERYDAARSWWGNLLEGEESIGIPLAVSVGFVRLVTNPRVMSPPMTSEEAVSLVRNWLQKPNVNSLDAGPNHFDHLLECLVAAGRAGRFVPMPIWLRWHWTMEQRFKPPTRTFGHSLTFGGSTRYEYARPTTQAS